MANITKIQLPNGTTYDIRDTTKSTVSITQTITSGNELARIIIDGISTPIYAPSSSSSVTSVNGEIGDVILGGTLTSSYDSNAELLTLSVSID